MREGGETGSHTRPGGGDPAPPPPAPVGHDPGVANAGLRLLDVRDPNNPTEVAYFNPGDIDPKPGETKLDHAWGHVHYEPATGQIWFATADGGFWVVRIEGKIRNYLRLDAKNATHRLSRLNIASSDPGRAGTVGLKIPKPPGGYINLAPYYCTLAGLTVP